MILLPFDSKSVVTLSLSLLFYYISLISPHQLVKRTLFAIIYLPAPSTANDAAILSTNTVEVVFMIHFVYRYIC